VDRYAKSVLNRDKASRLQEEWGIIAIQVRYRETGTWYASLSRFPAALLDDSGYVLFGTEEEYKVSSYLHIGKQISVPKGISQMPTYVRVIDLSASAHPAIGTKVTLEEAFHEILYKNYTRVGQETGYWAHYFLRELRKKGGVATAKRMLLPSTSNKISKGLQALIDAGRIDLSVEATALDPRFRKLFTESELQEAQRLLNSLPSYVQRRTTAPESNYPDELDITRNAEFTEGALRQVTINAYERDPAARRACIKKYGYQCAVCDMSFKERYGSIGAKFIHVHHKKPLALRRTEYRIKPTEDLIPVCPNCHAMLHTQNPPLGIEELRAIIGNPA
jgi:5-methylcytosine-specific restriction protein A